MSSKRLLSALGFAIILELLVLVFIVGPSSFDSQNQQALSTLVQMPTAVVAVANPSEDEPESAEVVVASPEIHEEETDVPEEVAIAATDTPLALPTEAPLATDVFVGTPSTLPDRSTSEADVPQVINRPPPQAVEDQVVIRFAPNTTAQERANYVQSIGGTVSQTIAPLDTMVVYISEPIAGLSESAIVVEAEPDYYVSALLDISIPTSDPYYPDQWALPAIGVSEVWLQHPADAPQVTVAVIDSGICLDHPDLAGRILAGYDFLEDDSTPQDELGHGCGVAGIIAANIDNGIGIAGIAPNAQIMPLRVLDASGIGTYSDVAAAMVYAVDNGAEIINLSLGGASASSVLENAVNYAVSHGVVVVAAAGNTGGSVLYPAAYEPVIAVGSLDPDLQQSSFSANGPEVDIWAPGRSIMMTDLDGSYVFQNGTSFAAPIVAGMYAIEANIDISYEVTETPTEIAATPITSIPSTSSPEINSKLFFWSPSASILVYWQQNYAPAGPGDQPYDIILYNAETEENIILASGGLVGPTSFTISGDSINFWYNGDPYQADPNTGMVTPILTNLQAVKGDFAPDGGLLAYVTVSGEIRIRDLVNNEEYSLGVIEGVATLRNIFPQWSPDGRYIAFAANNQLVVIDPIINNPSGKLHIPNFASPQGEISSTTSYFAWSDDGTKLYDYMGSLLYTVESTNNSSTPIQLIDTSFNGLFTVFISDSELFVRQENTDILHQLTHNNEVITTSITAQSMSPPEITAQAVADGFDFPVGKPDAVGYYIALDFVEFYDGTYHPAEDWNGNGGGNTDLGDPVYAIANGVVLDSNYYSTWGNIILIEHTLPDGTKIWSQYAHLQQRDVSSGEVIKGQQIGTIGQGDGNQFWAHLHFEIRTQYRSSSAWVTGWSESQVREYYTDPTDFINSHRQIGGGGGSCPGPSLNSPSDGYVSSSQTISFSWAALSGCTFNGYTFRIKNTSDMDSGGTTIVDTGEGGTSRSDTISSSWNNQDLWWGVRAANAPDGASWSVRRFRIEPGSTCNPNSDQVAFFVDANYGGQCIIKGVGDYADPGSIGLPNDSISSIKVGSNVRVEVCGDDNYGATCETFENDDSDLGNNSIGSDQISSARVTDRNPSCNPGTGQAAFYVDPNYSGQCVVKDVGDYPDPGSISLPNDSISSIRLGNNVKIELCGDDNFGATCETFQADDSNLGDNSIGDNQVSSARVQFIHPVLFHKDANYGGGWCAIPGAGWFNVDGCTGWNDIISSISVQPGWSVRGWEHDTRQGASRCFTSSVSNLAGVQTNEGGTVDIDNAISSVQVYESSNCPFWPFNAPSNLQVIGITTGQVDLTWTDNTSDESYFRLESSTDNVNWGFLGTSTIASFSDTGLSCDTTYYYRVQGYRSSDGVYSGFSNTASATTNACVTNDDFNSPIIIGSLPFTDTMDTSPATNAGDDPVPSCAATTGKTVWYSFTPTIETWMRVDTEGSDFDTTLSVWTGTRGNLAQVACDDDAGTGTLSRVDVNLTPGTTYYVMVGGFGGGGGNLVLNAVTDTIAPSGQITSPQDLSHQSGNPMVLSASTTDDLSGVDYVEYYGWSAELWSNQEWIYLGQDDTAPYNFSWDVSVVEDGWVWIGIKVYDNAGNWADGDAWSNFAVDQTAPDSAVNSLSNPQTTTSFSVNWTASDRFTTSDLLLFDVQFEENSSGNWINWVSNEAILGTQFFGTAGNSYCFRSRATDLAGNVENWPAGADTCATVSALPPPNQNLVRNGDFIGGYAEWSTWGDIDTALVNDVLQFKHRSDGTEGVAAFYQDINYTAPALAPFEIQLDLGNNSSVAKELRVSLRHHQDWNESFTCSFMIPAHTPLTTYTVRGITEVEWSNTRFEVQVDPADGIPDALMDNVSVIYDPALSLSSTECVDAYPIPLVTYTSFESANLDMYVIEGQNVALLVPSLDYSIATLNNLVSVFDDTYDYYANITGREPIPLSTYNGLTTIAVVPSTCGAGCGYLGYTGIEFLDWYFDDVAYSGVFNNQEYDQAPFYEFGRNFWFYGNQIEYKGADDRGVITTGFAVFMRFMAMDAVGISPRPYNGTDFAVFRSEVEGLLQTYLADTSLNWDNTLRIDVAPTNSLGLGGADMFASFMFELRNLYGDPFIETIWKEVENRPVATSTQMAVDNFVIAASISAGENLKPLFVDEWRWSISAEAIAELTSLFGTPEWQANYYDTTQRWDDNDFSDDFVCGEIISGSTLSVNYDNNAPCTPSMDGDTWVGDYTATLYFDAGEYIFLADHDDAMRLWIDDVLVVDTNTMSSECVTVNLVGGIYNLRAMLREDSGGARVNVSWGTDQSICPPSGEMTAPTPNSHHNSPTVHMAANAVDHSGTGILRVDFLATWPNSNGWQTVYSDDTAPYEFDWDVSGIDEGTISLYFFIYDNAGNVTGVSDTSFTLDRTAPSSAVGVLSDPQTTTSFTTNWSGTDNITALNELEFDVQYEINGSSTWTDWIVQQVSTDSLFNGVTGSSYCFRSRARNLAGNIEDYPIVADTCTTISSEASTTSISGVVVSDFDGSLLDGILVGFADVATGTVTGFTCTAVDGSYVLDSSTVAPPEEAVVVFAGGADEASTACDDTTAGLYYREWFDNVFDAGTGTILDLSVNDTASNVDFNLTQTGTPSTPSISVPSGLIVDTSPDLVWNTVQSASAYDVYLTGPAAFAPLLTTVQSDDVCVTGVCTYAGTTFATPLPVGNYALFIRGRNPLTETGAWSASMQFQIAPPTQPFITAPSGSVTENPPTIVWTEAETAFSYDLYLTGGTYSKIWTVSDTTCDDSGSCSTPVPDVLSGGVYAVFVRAKNEIGLTAWSPQYSFTIKPDAPVFLSPEGILTDNFRPDYQWQSVDGVTAYSLYVTGPGTSLFLTYDAAVVCDGGTGLCTVNPGNDLNQDLQYGVHAAWVQSRVGAAKSGWSNGLVFTVVPGIPQLTAPISPTSENTPDFVWAVVTGATSYDIYLTGPGVNHLQNYDAATYCDALTCTVNTGLTLGDGVYAAYVLSRNGTTKGEWSSIWAFTVNTAPPLVESSGSDLDIPPSAETSEEPQATDEAIETPIPTDEATETPIPTDEATETPIPTDEATETLIPTDEVTETPIPTEVATETPIPTDEVTETQPPSAEVTEVTDGS